MLGAVHGQRGACGLGQTRPGVSEAKVSREASFVQLGPDLGAATAVDEWVRPLR